MLLKLLPFPGKPEINRKNNYLSKIYVSFYFIWVYFQYSSVLFHYEVATVITILWG